MTQSMERIAHLLRTWEFRPVVEPAEKGKTSFWKRLYNAWMRFARVLGKANTFVLLTIVYVLLIGPASIVLKLIRKDLLDRRAEDRGSYWYDKGPDDHGLDRSKHQF